VAADSSGNFVIVWQTYDDFGLGVFGQRYASSGAPLGGEFRINTQTSFFQAYPSVAAGSSGNFVVVWQSDFQDGGLDRGVFGQRFSSSGAALGSEFRVNTYTTGFQHFSSVAADSSGNFVVIWFSAGQDGSAYGIFGQRFSSSGAPLGSEFRVNTYTTGFQYFPSVAAGSSGNFVVVWRSYLQDGSSMGLFGQRYASSGAALGSEFRVNTYTTGGQYRPSIAADSGGNFVVSWDSAQDGSAFGIFGQRYASSGTPLGPEFRVNTFTPNSQFRPSVAADSPGNFVVVWQSFAQDGSASGVFGQRYGQIVPVELMRFQVE
jgi:hypothetical protein